MSRKAIIAGNWKMNKSQAETKELISELIPLVADAKSEVVICVPYTDIAMAVNMCSGSNIKVGAQNISWAESGAFTGEISPVMLSELGAEYVIIGHSERRQYFGETDSTVNAKIKTALANDFIPIVCVGETLAQREKNQTTRVLRKQIKLGFENIEIADYSKIIVAYEPIWAIGTGVTASVEEAETSIKVVRSSLAKLYGRANANKIRLQYGGSMNGGNAKTLMSQKNIDGGLIGGASLKAVDFTKVVKYYD